MSSPPLPVTRPILAGESQSSLERLNRTRQVTTWYLYSMCMRQSSCTERDAQSGQFLPCHESQMLNQERFMPRPQSSSR